MKRLVGFGAFYCPMCGERLDAGSAVCPGCGADTDAHSLYSKWQPVDCGEREKRRRVSRYRRKEVIYKLLFGAALAYAVPALLFRFGQLRHDDEGTMVATVLSAMFILIAVGSAIRGVVKKAPIHSPSQVSAGQSACLICGSINDLRSAYCIKCGCELPRSAPQQPVRAAPAKAAESAPARATQRPDYCQSCGARLDPDARFCENCGRPRQQ